MNLKIVLAAALMIAGGAYTSSAQQQKNGVTTHPATVSAKTFEASIKEYQKATDATKSASLLDEMKQQMMTGMSALKAEIASTKDKAAQDKLMEKHKSRMMAITEVNNFSRVTPVDKQGVTDALKKYAKTL